MRSPQNNVAVDINEFIFCFVRDGWLADPGALGLQSFLKADIDLDSADMSGEQGSHHLLSWDVQLASKRKSIAAEFKLYFHAEQLRTNGFGLFDKVRLITFLHYLKLRGGNQFYSYDIHLSDDRKQGALMFSNGVLIQFSAETGERNFYIKTVESGIDLTDESFSRLANARFVNSMFRVFSCEQWQKTKLSSDRPLRKLCAASAQAGRVQYAR